MRKFHTVLAAAMIGAAPLFTGAAAAQDYPNQPIVWLAPSSAGSGFDVVARIVTPKLSQVLGESVVVENVAGAGGTVGAAKAAEAKPDGYTILHININHTSAEALYKSLNYNLLESFDPILRFAISYHLFITKPDLEAKTLADVVAVSKADPGKLNYASAGIGASTFMCTELFKAKAEIDLTHIPYEGGGPALASIVSGETDFYCAPYSTAKPFIEEGKVKTLAVTSKERAPFLPDLPSASETVPGFDFISWYGLVVPKGTPVEIRDKIRAAMVETLADPDVKKKLSDLGFEPIDEGPEKFAAFLKQDVDTMKELVKQAGIEPK